MPENMTMRMTTTYGCQVVHNRIEGIVANPIAGPEPQNCSLVRLHAPIETMRAYWTAVREGCPPILPSSKSYFSNLNRVLLGGERVGIVTPAMVGHYWVAAGFYDFAVVGPEELDSDFHLGKCPWEGTAVSDFYIPYQHFQINILDPTFVQPPGLSIDPDVLFLNTISPGEKLPQLLNAFIP